MKNLLLVPTLLLALTPALTASDDHGAWVADFDEAVALAAETGKDLFVDFTGSDWCHWCKKLDKEVFSHDEFLVPARADFVLVSLDYPNSKEAKARVPNPERNTELAAKYNIAGYPTCLLMTAGGEVYGRMGYQKGGPDKYIESMIATRLSGKKQLDELAKLKKAHANAEDVLPVLERAVALLADMNRESLGVSIVAEMAQQAMAHDPDNASGLKLRAIKALLNAGQINETLIGDAGELDGQNEHGLLEQVVQAQFGMVSDADSARTAVEAVEKLVALDTLHEKAVVGSLLGQAAMWCDGPLEDHDRAVKLATTALTFRADLPGELITLLEELIG